MVTEIMGLLETAAIASSGFLVKKYVFLEPDLEAGKQRIFNWILFFLRSARFSRLGKMRRPWPFCL